MKQVKLITDGACHGNPGRGGWAFILRYGEHSREGYGCAPHTTNNRMEITAAIQGLRALKEPCQVEVVTDSEYLKNGATVWMPGWKRGNWVKKDKKPVINSDLWRELDEQLHRHRTNWVWTRGHSTHRDNNRCDELASMAARDQVSSG